MNSNALILGISPQHTSSVSVTDMEGKILFAASEERFNRIKCYNSIPLDALTHVACHFDVSRIEGVAIAGGHRFRKIDFLPSDQQERSLRNPLLLPRFLSKKDGRSEWHGVLKGLGIAAAPNWYDHHECHAASAYYACGMDDALVVTIDGGGDGLSLTISHGRQGTLRRLKEFKEDASLGFFYGAVTSGLGFRIFRHEGKLTGLAAYGDQSRLYSELSDLFQISTEGGDVKIRSALVEAMFKPDFPAEHLFLARNYASFLSGKVTLQQFRDALNNYRPGTAFRKHFGGRQYTQEDMAAAAQAVLEDSVLKLVRHYLQQTGCTNLVLAGGVVANVKLNQRLFNIEGVQNIFVAPYMGDEGLCVGAAYLHLKQHSPAFAGRTLDTMYLGPSYGTERVEQALQKAGVQGMERIDDPSVRARRIAELIAQDRVVGFFSGAMEFGPRSLGARSVLASAKQYEINDTLNKRMKRSEFMPFAPVLPHERARDVLAGKLAGSEFAAEFMTITYDVHEKYRQLAPAVVHVDGTARPQLIKKEKHPVYHDVLIHYEKLTGVPILVNTSFNMHEEPIVNTPEDAIRAFRQGCVDTLAIENFVVS
ncbi:carbamoyltransferase family protein [Paracidovorax cattleyae]|uniref:Carbamoyltransferase n=1 Tax=Paracidovorax cattleyae TaxID=80868 RepID=A0A1H0SDE8_9BURK|nr:carbamoyltransferase C-terminal domain-containing protein [Paracidovorax cattleyae]AVS73257.1 hypothetical protein C8240_03630 [Paracidovorax cattleyae]SDP39764.1 carbamoyltransferase [Paracidovorax cattleyae]